VEGEQFGFGNAPGLVYQPEQMDVGPYGRSPGHVGFTGSNGGNVPGVERGESR